MSKSTGKGKLEKFAELGQMPHVFQNFDYKQPQLLSANGPIDLKGKWDELVFKNGKPIVLELACGRGEYSVSLGQQFPENNYIGIDIKGNRMWTGAQHSLQLGLTNVAFLRTPSGLPSPTRTCGRAAPKTALPRPSFWPSTAN